MNAAADILQVFVDFDEIDEPTAVVEFDRLPTRVVPLAVLPDEALDRQQRRDLQLFFVGAK